MNTFSIDLENTKSFVSIDEISELLPRIEEINRELYQDCREPDKFLGWLTYPQEVEEETLRRIEECAEYVRSRCQILVVIGIGGSSLGSKAIGNALSDYFGPSVLEQQSGNKNLEIIYAGENLSDKYTSDLVRYLENRPWCLNVISKSGNTTVITVAFSILGTFEPNLENFGRWWEQLFAESEGKDGKGIFVRSVSYTRDLHSLGQLIQQGERNIFETILHITDSPHKHNIPSDLNMPASYLSGKTISHIREAAMYGAIQAHRDGGVPNIRITIPEQNAYWMGYLVYFFQKACALSGKLLGVDPFNQPGVEDYKRNMLERIKSN